MSLKNIKTFNPLKLALGAFALTMLPFCAGSPVVAAEKPAPQKGAAPSTVLPNLPSKKVIEYGWDDYLVPDLSYIRDNIREMEKRPFDGIVFRLPDSGGEVFNLKAWDEKKLEPQLQILKDIKWGKFTDNFVAMLALPESATVTTDWYSDDAWKKVLAHARFMARAANAAKCKGIMFDPEGDHHLWAFDEQKQASGKSFDEYAVQARKRGSQFMQAIMSEKPDARVLILHNYAHFFSITESVDPLVRAKVVKDDGYALLPAFTDGMLAAAAGAVQIIDGNEYSYFYNSPMQFYRGAMAMHQGNKVFAAPDVHGKYDQYMHAGQALYVDWIFNLRPEIHTTNPSLEVSPEDRVRWFEQNAYYALKTTDEYVWLYSETMDWWKNQTIPAGLEAGLISARGKIARGEDLGFEVSPEVFGAAYRKLEAKQNKTQ